MNYRDDVSLLAREWKVALHLGLETKMDFPSIAKQHKVEVFTLIEDVLYDMKYNVPIYCIESESDAYGDYECIGIEDATERMKYLLENCVEFTVKIK